MGRGIVNVIHYLDDFLIWSEDASRCARDLQLALSICSQLGLPAEPSKVEGPDTTITFLGIEIDSIKEELRLPQSKLVALKQLLASWSSKRVATKRELQVLLGHLNHAATVVPAGKSFLRHLINAMSQLRQQSHLTRLNTLCRSDIIWWLSFVERWNGINFFPCRPSIISDASGGWGCGAFCYPPNAVWFQVEWPPTWAGLNIAAKELLPLVIGAAIWGSSWHGRCVNFITDNQAVVQVLSSHSARDPHLAHLLRSLFFFQAQFRFEIKAQHIPGKKNKAADALSRNNLTDFFSIFPQACKQPADIPAPLLELLLDQSMAWTSPRWRTLFTSCLQRVLHPVPEPPTPQAKLDTLTSATSSASTPSH